MAHDFLGTFNKTQWTRFLVFARSQLPLVDARLEHLQAERIRTGTVSFVFQNGVPVSFTAAPTTYLGKLIDAYEVLGGNPFMDLRLRNRNQPIFLIRGTESVGAHTMSSGDVVGAPGQADAVSSELAHEAQTWLHDTMKSRFGRLERKIRRALDYSDELNREAQALALLKATVQTEGSLESIAQQVSELFNDPNYRAIFDDQGKDPFGFSSYAPFSSYDVVKPINPNFGVGRVNETPQRQNTGFIGPGEEGKA